MFDGIIFNDRIFGSMFDQARTSVARTAPGAEHVREQMEIRTAPFPLKNDLLLQNEEDIWKSCRTFAPKNFWLNVRPRGHSRSISVEHSAKLPPVGGSPWQESKADHLRLDM